MASSCSFRITRTAEDLAQTLTAISQRLVKLEQRLEALELQSTQTRGEQQSDEEIVMLDGVDQLLEECKGLLNTSAPEGSIEEQSDQYWEEHRENQDNIAA
tara:strand:- start:107 stop:409 length:303 start_codon:yes stop_codon:yes gene_type:complete